MGLHLYGFLFFVLMFFDLLYPFVVFVQIYRKTSVLFFFVSKGSISWLGVSFGVRFGGSAMYL